MYSSKPITFPPILERLLKGEELNLDESTWIMQSWLNNEIPPVQTGALLTAFRSKGVSGLELSGMAKVLQNACNIPGDLPDFELVDTCGTGGDGANTFNISTAVAFVSASCGANIAKHGNRSASGKVGSADVLENLGIPLQAPLDKVVQALKKFRITFLFAPSWHSSLVNLAPLRKSLGIRTVFNLLGPLVNPLRPNAQVLGVASPDLLDPMSFALKSMELKRAVVVHGAGGLDEASLQGPNEFRFLEDGSLKSEIFTPEDFGLTSISNESLKGDDIKTNSLILKSLLMGEGQKPHKEVVALNAGLVLWASGLEDDLSIAIKKSLLCLETNKSWILFNELKTFLSN